MNDSEFTNYVFAFHGEQGLIPLFKNGKALTTADIAGFLPALRTVQSLIGPPWGEGDSTDRETLRRIAEHNGFTAD